MDSTLAWRGIPPFVRCRRRSSRSQYHAIEGPHAATGGANRWSDFLTLFGVDAVILDPFVLRCGRLSTQTSPVDFILQRSLGLGLDEKAIEAVKQWKFKPGYKDGRPVTVAATIEVNFRLL